ncbi:MAG TPA: class I SAM-dependent methyltransferase [Frankiaceae bacterium]|nr:class I SAM-dependent methyltransferase [Frankiaceae bacterium]
MTTEHWDGVFTTKAPDDVSWFQAEPATSLRLLRAYAPPPASVLDVGSGNGVLPDRLLAGGWPDVTVLDVSAAALDAVRGRLGDAVTYAVSDVTAWRPARTYGAWHDRAVFHFLTSFGDVASYVARATAAVAPGGVAVLATFAPDGPEQCSGLPAKRYAAEALAGAFGGAFTLEAAEREEHVTPWGAVQPFTWVVLRRR